MISSRSKFQKIKKPKFKKDFENEDYGQQQKNKPKHHDKSFYKLLRQEKREYGI